MNEPKICASRQVPIGLVAFIFGLMPVLEASEVFLEKGGLVVMEAESTRSSLRKWKEKTDVEDYSGKCHLEFTGNRIMNGPPDSPLRYKFQIQKPGKYRLTLRARKRLETEREDLSNDCYVKVSGNYEAGGGAPLDILEEDTKMFGGHKDGWGWAVMLDHDHKKYDAIYDFKAGETYELTISGRSKNFNLDRILFVHESHKLREVQRENPPESQGEGASRMNSKLAPRVTRKLHNQEGQTIEAKLVSKQGNTLIAIVRGRRYEIPMDTLSKEDQEFISEWQPAE
ncbi:MAG: hypothetical protein R3242_04030 [Akkermansiaceae bacterium]|nr:hypothetical protein [Akkermansiaceae bacterium]